MRRAIFLVSFWFSIALLLCDAAADEADSSVILNLSLEASIDRGPVPVVYVRGEMAGIAPGPVVTPLRDGGVAIEIGLPQVSRVPLYSFVFGPAEIEQQSADVVVTHFGFLEPKQGDVWNSVFIEPNAKRTVKITKQGDGIYGMTLPKEPYTSIMDFWRNSKIAPYEPEWFANIVPANDKSTAGGVDHLVFNRAKNETEFLSASDTPSWSGGQVAAAFPFPIHREQWTVRSDPPEADVLNEDGVQGQTVVTVPVPITGTIILFVQKDGYLTMSHTKCRKTLIPGGAELYCRLKKVR